MKYLANKAAGEEEEEEEEEEESRPVKLRKVEIGPPQDPEMSFLHLLHPQLKKVC